MKTIIVIMLVCNVIMSCSIRSFNAYEKCPDVNKSYKSKNKTKQYLKQVKEEIEADILKNSPKKEKLNPKYK